MKRSRRAPERLGEFAAVEQLEDALELDHTESTSDDAQEEGRYSKAARRSGRRSRPAPTITADQLSVLLAGAPALVDMLIQEDSIRCITLVARDAVNLSIATGGRISLEPVWDALAALIQKEGRPGIRARQRTDSDSCESSWESDEECLPRLPGASPPPAKQHHCTRNERTPQPARPPALQVVKAAVAANPARQVWVPRNEALHSLSLTLREIEGASIKRSGRGGRAMVSDLVIRAAAHRKHGDAAQLEARRRASAERQTKLAETREQRRRDNEVQRRAEIQARLEKGGVEGETLEEQLQALQEAPFMCLVREYISYGYVLPNLGMVKVVKGILDWHYEMHARQERQLVLDHRLQQEGLLPWFRLDWRYFSFQNSGLVEEVEAVVAVAQRQQEGRRRTLERLLELEERLDAACLSCVYSATSPLFARWAATGEGDIEGQVAALQAELRRGVELAALLEHNGLLYRRKAQRCRQYVAGLAAPGTTAADIVQSLLFSLASQHKHTLRLLNRLAAERLPPDLSHPAAKAFLANSSSRPSLESVVEAVRASHSGRFAAVSYWPLGAPHQGSAGRKPDDGDALWRLVAAAPGRSPGKRFALVCPGSAPDT